MDARQILDHLLSSGKELLSKGKGFAEDKLGVPAGGEERTSALSGLGKGALGGGLLALLVGTRTGRKAGGKLLKYGSIAAVAAVAYQAYQSWQSDSSNASLRGDAEPIASGEPIENLDDNAANNRALLLIRTMIAAANADGVIDSSERAAIKAQVAELGLDSEAQQFLAAELANPPTSKQIAEQIDSAAAASEVYLLSSLICDDTNDDEKRYLSNLSQALKLPNDLVAALSKQAVA